MNKIISVQTLHEELNKKGYICDVTFASRVATCIHAKPTSGAFLYGPAGTGKSYLPQIMAEVLKRKMFFHQCSAGTREDDLLMRIFPSENTQSGVEILYGKVYQAAVASNDEPVILVFDEWDKTRPSADGYMLDFLQYGRLSIPGDEIKANLNNMIIFFTANDEREFSEALLRRFPKIDLAPLPSRLIKTALEITHKEHVNIPNVIALYQRCLIADMPKPATIQELRQLLDAIDFLGKGSDWNDLVYQYITKTNENHELLIRAEGKSLDSLEHENGDGREINPGAYNDYKSGDNSDNSVHAMPKLANFQKFNSDFSTDGEFPADEKIYGIFNMDIPSYSGVNDLASEIPDNPRFPAWAEVIGNKIIMRKPLPIHQYDMYLRICKRSDKDTVLGEMMLKYDDCSIEEVRRLIFRKYDVHKSSKQEIIARKHIKGGQKDDCFDLRWTPKGGLEIVAPVSNIGANNLYDALRMNGRHNMLDAGDRVCTIGGKLDTYVIPINLTYSGYRINDNVGSIMLKSLKNHKGYCEMVSRDISSSAHLGSGIASASKHGKYTSYNGVNTISGKGIIIKHVEGSSSCGEFIRVTITSLPNIDLFRIALRWFESIPLYQCFKSNKRDIASKLVKSGWRPSRSESSSLISKCSRYKCLLVFDHVIFWRTFRVSDYDGVSTITLRANIKSTLTELRRLRRRFEQN